MKTVIIYGYVCVQAPPTTPDHKIQVTWFYYLCLSSIVATGYKAIHQKHDRSQHNMTVPSAVFHVQRQEPTTR